MIFDNTYVTVELDAIAANFRTIRKKAGVPVMAVIKADAYGHGALPVARVLESQCAYFGVATIAEALELRRGSIAKPILVLGPMAPEAFSDAILADVRPCIFCYEDAVELSRWAEKLGKTARFHLAVDTGMSRIGLQVTEEDADIAKDICALPGLEAEGLFTHFATADSKDLTRTHAQVEKFRVFLEMLKARGVEIPLRHIDNSAGIVNFGAHYEMARAGIILYGMEPSHQVDMGLLPVAPALSWYSRIAHVKMLEPGREISYGGTFVVEKPTKVATVAVGYGDGYKRSLSGKFYVLIHGQPAPILGRICMDQMMVDVSDIADVKVGDRVTLMGRDGDRVITPEEIGEAAGSFNYEFVCSISRRVPRYYYRNGELVQKVDYLLKSRTNIPPLP